MHLAGTLGISHVAAALMIVTETVWSCIPEVGYVYTIMVETVTG